MADRLDGNFAPITTETEVANLPVIGGLPAALHGALLRNGPNPQFPSGHPGAHWFTGDGMLHAVRIADGRASYGNRWVRTPKFLAERATGHGLYAGYAGEVDLAAPARSFAGGVANTNVVWHAGRLLALEEQHLPVELDPVTLETVGICDFDGALNGPFTAHPKIDPATGEMLFFGYHVGESRGPGLHWGVIDTHGRLSRLEHFPAPYASMVHDFIVTAEHVVFPIMPLTASLARVQAGRPAYLWEPGAGAFVGVMRRDAGIASLRWYRGEACFVFHVMNAWDDGTSIVADVMQYEAPALFPRADGVPPPAVADARLVRWTLDLSGATDRLAMTPLDDLGGEFPRIDDRLAGRPNRHGWTAANTQERDMAAIAHFDLKTGSRSLWLLPEGDAVSEPVFVPRSEQEGDGWLLAIAWRAREAASDLVVLDALSVTDGPVGSVRLPNRVPFGFHGNWIAA